MSQVTHPYGYRLVTLRPWTSRWFSRRDKGEYRETLKADTLLRQYLEKKLRSMFLSEVTIERDLNTMRVALHTSRPGLLIGKGGEGVTAIKADILKLASKKNLKIPKEVRVEIVDIPSPEQNAKIVALQIAHDLERRMTFKRVMRMHAEKVMEARGVKGVRIVLAGRLGGSDMSRSEETKLGSIPLQFIRADIDYAVERARMTYGTIGIKVWINKGDSLKNAGNTTNRGDNKK